MWLKKKKEGKQTEKNSDKREPPRKPTEDGIKEFEDLIIEEKK